MRFRDFLYIPAFSILVLLFAKCSNRPTVRVDTVLVVVDSLPFSLNNSTLSFYNKDLLLQSISLKASSVQVRFENAEQVNEIRFKVEDGKDWTFFAKGGDSIRFTFVSETPQITVLNREAREWDHNYPWLSSRILRNNEPSSFDNYQYLDRTISDRFSGVTDDQEINAELKKLAGKVKSEFAREKSFIDSLVKGDLMSPEAAQYYLRSNHLKYEIFRLEDKNNCRSVLTILSQIIELDSSKTSIRDKEIQTLLDKCAVRIITSDSVSQEISLSYTLSGFSFNEELVGVLKFKAASLLYEKLSENKRRGLVEAIKQKSNLNHANTLADLHPSAEIFSIGLSLKDSKGKDIPSDVFLLSHKGRKVYVDLWAGWCGPCILELPKLSELSIKYAGRVDFVYLSIDRDFESWQRALKAHFDRNESNSYYLDASSQEKLYQRLKISTIPRYILFDESGLLIHSNAPRPNDPALEELLRAEPQ